MSVPVALLMIGEYLTAKMVTAADDAFKVMLKQLSDQPAEADFKPAAPAAAPANPA